MKLKGVDMDTGKKIKESRDFRGIRAADLAAGVGVSAPTLSMIENGRLKGGVDPGLVVSISNYLNDKTILTTYLENNPVYQSIIPKIFPDLNNIRRDPAVIFSRFAAEAEEAVEAARILAEIFSNADPTRSPNYHQTLKNKLEQIIDVQRCAEILFLQLIQCDVITDEGRREVHANQQQKCIDRGHHIPEIGEGAA
jgi:transcriptional regulator with XRE-family HTH domain